MVISRSLMPRKLRQRPAVKREPAGDIWRVTVGKQSLHIASKKRWTLYRKGVDVRMERLARIYGATKLASEFAGKTVLDIGANAGEFALWAHERGARVVAFEPDPLAFKALVANTSDTNIATIDAAAWNENGNRPLFMDTKGASSSLIGSGDGHEVRTRRLADVLDEAGIDEVFFLKADCEGAEPEMLEGAREALPRITYIAIDCGPEREGEDTVKACEAILRDAGFEVERMPSRRVVLFGRNKKTHAARKPEAPTVFVPEASEPKPVTLAYPYYENPQTLREHVARWSGFPASVCQHLSAIVVDDGSPENPAHEALRGFDAPFPIRLFRIEEDVRWNWLAARNLAMHHAEGWCLLTDMDHFVTAEVAQSLIWGAHDEDTIYRFSRFEHDGAKIHSHPNSWFMTRDMFWRIGGYDEALSGYYGTDGEYRRRCAATAPVEIMPDALIRYEKQGDASTTRYKRKQPEDRAVQKIIKARGKDWGPKTLSYPWHEVEL